MPLSGDVGGDLHPVGETDAGDLADSGVRLARGLGGHLGADTALEWRGIKGRAVLERIKATGERRHGRLRRFALTASLGELIYCCHLEKEDPEGSMTI